MLITFFSAIICADFGLYKKIKSLGTMGCFQTRSTPFDDQPQNKQVQDKTIIKCYRFLEKIQIVLIFKFGNPGVVKWYFQRHSLEWKYMNFA